MKNPTRMKLKHITLMALMAFFTISITAQINSGVGYMHGTYKKGDTAVDYHDEPSMHDHESVKIIKEKQLTPAEAKKAGLKVPPYMEHKNGGKSDNTAQAGADTTSAPDTTAQAATVPQDSQSVVLVNTMIASTGCDCVNRNFLWAAIALLFLAYLFDLYSLAQTMRDKIRPAMAAVCHGLLATAGMTLLIIYSIFQITPIASLVLLCIAVALGLILLYNDVEGKPSSKPFVIGQAAIAAVGFVLLIVFTLGH
jgi:hypothetical protein